MTVLDGHVRVKEDGRNVAAQPFADLDAAWAAAHDLPQPLQRLAADLGAIARDEHAFEFHSVGSFFERVRDADSCPLAVGVHRR